MNNTRTEITWTLLALAALTLTLACGDDEDLDGPRGGPDASVPAPDARTGPASVKFDDTALESCVRAALTRPTGDLFPGDMASLRNLECQDRKIASLAGLEHATGLVDLSLFENKISKIDALAGMTQLTSLQLGHNQIVDITPLASRTTIFVDPKRDSKSIWRVGLMNDDMVERIKWELRTKNAPVIVIYNHYLYWHADIVVGYDDTINTVGCPMVDGSVAYFKKKGATSYVDKINKHKQAQGGCSNKGIFYRYTPPRRLSPWRA